MARRTKQDALATREALLDAAERVFLRQGVSRTSLSDIAQAAGVTRGAVYWHFKDKAALFNAMMDRVALPFNTKLEQLIQAPGDPLPAWCAHLQQVLRQIVEDEQTQRVVQIAMQKVEHAEEMGAVIDHHVEMHRLNTEMERQVFERAAAARNCRLPAPADQLAHGFHAMVNGLIYNWLLDQSFDLQATGRISMRSFLHGIGLTPNPTASSTETPHG